VKQENIQRPIGDEYFAPERGLRKDLSATQNSLLAKTL